MKFLLLDLLEKFSPDPDKESPEGFLRDKFFDVSHLLKTDEYEEFRREAKNMINDHITPYRALVFDSGFEAFINHKKVFDVLSMLFFFESRRKGQRSLEDLFFLDVGCGSKENYESGQFKPFICRLLYCLNLKVCGVDIDSNKGEPFDHKKIDLIKEGAFESYLLGTEFDYIHARDFFNSPKLTQREVKEEDLKRIVYQQIYNLLKTGGVYLSYGYNEYSVYIKR